MKTGKNEENKGIVSEKKNGRPLKKMKRKRKGRKKKEEAKRRICMTT